MTFLALDAAVSSGPPNLEVRWIRSGALDPRVLEWFSRFPATAESREDDYLIHPDLDGLAVKIRGGGALEVKFYRGYHGVLDVPGHARGHLEFWQKWSFPLGRPTLDVGAATTWRSVHKTRRVSFFSLDQGQLAAGLPGLRQATGCAVELTEIKMHGESWWTLAFEATGPHDGLEALLRATAALVFDPPMEDGLKLSPEDSGSYVSWLRERISAEPPTAGLGDHPGGLLGDRAADVGD